MCSSDLIAGDRHPARRADQLTGILADERAVGLIEGGNQNEIGGFEGRFDEHPTHASGRTGNRDTNLIHVIPGINDIKREGAYQTAPAPYCEG